MGSPLEKLSPTKRSTELEYAIREIAVLASKIAKSGQKIIHLNIGDPVKFDFKTPNHIKEALIDAVKDNYNMYSASEGQHDLRSAISYKLSTQHVNIPEDEIIITSGISEAIQMLLGVLVDEGDEILLPSPTYPSYRSYIKFYGGIPVTYETLEEENWNPSFDDIKKKISRKTKAILLVNPNNPTGAVWSEKIIKEIIQIAAENNIPLISDEVYDEIIFSGTHIPTAKVANEVPVIGFNGFSKVHLMTGWRLGYMYFHNPNGVLDVIKESVLKTARIRLCANTPVQKAGVAALKGPKNHITDLINKLRIRRDICVKRLLENEIISTNIPEGAFYLFPKIDLSNTKWKTDKEFVEDLLKETGVCLVPGSGFGKAQHFRLVFLPTPAVLEEALDKINNFLRKSLRRGS